MTTWCDYLSLSFLGKENSHNDYHFCFSDDDIIYSLTATYKHLFLEWYISGKQRQKADCGDLWVAIQWEWIICQSADNKVIYLGLPMFVSIQFLFWSQISTYTIVIIDTNQIKSNQTRLVGRCWLKVPSAQGIESVIWSLKRLLKCPESVCVCVLSVWKGATSS